MATSRPVTVYRFDSPNGRYCYFGTTVNLGKRVAGHRSSGPLSRHLAGLNQAQATRHFRKINTVNRKDQALEQRDRLIRQAFIEAYENRSKPLPLNQTMPGIDKAISMKMVDGFLDQRPDAKEHLGRAFGRSTGKIKDRRKRKSAGDAPTFAELLADQNEASAQREKEKAGGKGKNENSGGFCGCLGLLVLIIGAILILDPGFFDRIRGVSPQPAARASIPVTQAGVRVPTSDRAQRVLSSRTATASARRTSLPAAQTRHVISSRAFVYARSCPDRSCRDLGRPARGSKVAVLGEVQGEMVGGSASWWRVVLPGESREAYIHGPLLGPNPPPPLVPTATPRPTEVVVQAPPTTVPVQVPPTATPQPQPAPQQQPAAPVGEQARVVWVTDGDSIEVEMNGQRFRVRYIGINTPERRESCSNAAKDANARLVNGRTVTMVRDVSNTDRYGRLLRYIYVDNTFVNEVLVRDGFAENSVWPPDTRHANRFRALEAEARAAGRGCHPTGVFADGNTER